MIATTSDQGITLIGLGLPKSTADSYHPFYDDKLLHQMDDGFDEDYDAFAWSLSALLEVMRQANAVTTLQVTSLSTFMRCKDMGFIWQNDLYINDPVSAAYEMVCYLLRNGHIKKEEER